MSLEIWRPVVGYEGTYEVSASGMVRRVGAARGARVGHVLAQQELRKRAGYMAVGLRGPGGKKLHRVHRLVAHAFLGPSSAPLVRHLDGDPKNNRVSNLAYGDASENAQDRTRHGRSRDSNQFTAATQCRNGHEYTPENTKTKRLPGGKTTRKCRVCLRAADQRRYQREKAARAQ